MDDALDALAARHPHRASVVEVQYFGGLTVEGTGDALAQTVLRDWKLGARVPGVELRNSGELCERLQRSTKEASP